MHSDSINLTKNILIFGQGNPFSIGGVQRSLSILCDYLCIKHSLLLCVWEDDDGRLSNRNNMAYPIDNSVVVQFISRDLNILNEKTIPDIIQSFNPDIAVVINSSSVGLELLKILKQFDIPCVYSIRGSSEYCLKYLWSCKYSMELAFRASDSIHVLMDSYKDFFDDDLKNKIQVIPSPIKTAQKYANSDKKNTDGNFIVCYSGRFSFEKRVDLFIQAFAQIASEFPDWICVLFGNGPLEKSLEEMIVDWGLINRIYIKNCKNTDEMYLEYPKVHILVLPSEQEGCPMALREAMAHKIPVIGYAECSGTNEIIKDGVNGFLVDNDDRVSRLSEAMIKLMEDAHLRKHMGEEALKTSLDYAPDLINSMWEKLIIDTSNGEGIAKKENTVSSHKYHAAQQELSNIKVANIRKFCKFNQDSFIYKQFRTEYLLVFGHQLFNHTYYLDQYFDVKATGEDPLLHYISVGWKKGYNPSPQFNTIEYINTYLPDNDEKICPLVHYYLRGRFLQYTPIPLLEYFVRTKEQPILPYNAKNDFAFEYKYFNLNT